MDLLMIGLKQCGSLTLLVDIGKHRLPLLGTAFETLEAVVTAIALRLSRRRRAEVIVVVFIVVCHLFDELFGGQPQL